jgi:hypothetical protein
MVAGVEFVVLSPQALASPAATSNVVSPSRASGLRVKIIPSATKQTPGQLSRCGTHTISWAFAAGARRVRIQSDQPAVGSGSKPIQSARLLARRARARARFCGESPTLALAIACGMAIA